MWPTPSSSIFDRGFFFATSSGVAQAIPRQIYSRTTGFQDISVRRSNFLCNTVEDFTQATLFLLERKRFRISRQRVAVVYDDRRQTEFGKLPDLGLTSLGIFAKLRAQLGRLKLD